MTGEEGRPQRSETGIGVHTQTSAGTDDVPHGRLGARARISARKWSRPARKSREPSLYSRHDCEVKLDLQAHFRACYTFESSTWLQTKPTAKRRQISLYFCLSAFPSLFSLCLWLHIAALTIPCHPLQSGCERRRSSPAYPHPLQHRLRR